ncbi:hypothetical protein [Nocardia uniformis]|uniref:hypothetical protein n=1 Tax=Nocardia uniformis TaxID=53432 RepID=UPI00082F6BD4|nr:hypothetical protein [Nocardia uniformis]
MDHVIDFGIGKLFDVVKPQALLGTSSTAPELVAAVRAAADRMYDLVDREPELLRLLLVEASAIDAELAQRLLGLEAMVAVWVAGELRRGVDGGWVRADIDPDVLAHTVLMLIMPGVVKEIRGVGNPRLRAHSTDMMQVMLEKALRVRTVGA